jgi:hypothetical protein
MIAPDVRSMKWSDELVVKGQLEGPRCSLLTIVPLPLLGFFTQEYILSSSDSLKVCDSG